MSEESTPMRFEQVEDFRDTLTTPLRKVRYEFVYDEGIVTAEYYDDATGRRFFSIPIVVEDHFFALAKAMVSIGAVVTKA